MRYIFLLISLVVLSLLILFWLKILNVTSESFSPSTAEDSQEDELILPNYNSTNPAQDLIQESQNKSLKYQDSVQKYQDQVIDQINSQ